MPTGRTSHRLVLLLLRKAIPLRKLQIFRPQPPFPSHNHNQGKHQWSCNQKKFIENIGLIEDWPTESGYMIWPPVPLQSRTRLSSTLTGESRPHESCREGASRTNATARSFRWESSCNGWSKGGKHEPIDIIYERTKARNRTQQRSLTFAAWFKKSSEGIWKEPQIC